MGRLEKEIKRYEVYWVSLDPTIGSEMKKTRPCVVVSPNELNRYLATVIVIPLTSTIKKYKYRTSCHILGKEGSLAIDQIKAVDKRRIGKFIDKLNQREISDLQSVLVEMIG